MAANRAAVRRRASRPDMTPAGGGCHVRLICVNADTGALPILNRIGPGRIWHYALHADL